MKKLLLKSVNVFRSIKLHLKKKMSWYTFSPFFRNPIKKGLIMQRKNRCSTNISFFLIFLNYLIFVFCINFPKYNKTSTPLNQVKNITHYCTNLFKKPSTNKITKLLASQNFRKFCRGAHRRREIEREVLTKDGRRPNKRRIEEDIALCPESAMPMPVWYVWRRQRQREYSCV